MRWSILLATFLVVVLFTPSAIRAADESNEDSAEDDALLAKVLDADTDADSASSETDTDTDDDADLLDLAQDLDGLDEDDDAVGDEDDDDLDLEQLSDDELSQLVLLADQEADADADADAAADGEMDERSLLTAVHKSSVEDDHQAVVRHLLLARRSPNQQIRTVIRSLLRNTGRCIAGRVPLIRRVVGILNRVKRIPVIGRLVTRFGRRIGRGIGRLVRRVRIRFRGWGRRRRRRRSRRRRRRRRRRRFFG